MAIVYSCANACVIKNHFLVRMGGYCEQIPYSFDGTVVQQGFNVSCFSAHHGYKDRLFELQ